MKTTKKPVADGRSNVAAEPPGAPRCFHRDQPHAEQQGDQQDVEHREPQVAEGHLADAHGVVVQPEWEQEPHREVLGG